MWKVREQHCFPTQFMAEQYNSQSNVMSKCNKVTEIRKMLITADYTITVHQNCIPLLLLNYCTRASVFCVLLFSVFRCQGNPAVKTGSVQVIEVR